MQYRLSFAFFIVTLVLLFPAAANAGGGLGSAGTAQKAAAVDDGDEWTGGTYSQKPATAKIEEEEDEAEDEDEAADEDGWESPAKETPAVTPPLKGGGKPGANLITVSYARTRNTKAGEIVNALKQSRIFEELTKSVTDTISLKHPLTVEFEDCGVINAFYSPDDYKISICYELIDQYLTLFGSQKDISENQVGLHIVNATIFTFYHELGHALIHILEIPITGKEEDAADDLATLILIEAGDEGVAAVFSAILEFASSAEDAETRLEDLAFWDEHSLDSQRVYNEACLVYGSAPEKHGDLVGEDGLPSARAERCPAEYQQKYTSWNKLLEPHFH